MVNPVITPPCPHCLAFYLRQRDDDCPLHPEAARFWRIHRPPVSSGQDHDEGEHDAEHLDQDAGQQAG